MKVEEKTGTQIESERQLKSFSEACERLRADPVRAKEFMVRRGFITPEGKLTARYRLK